MKKDCNYLNELTDKTGKYKVKVKVIHKSRPQQSPGKKKVQRMVLKDDKGNKISASLFGTDIDSYEEDILRKGEYEISEAPIQKIPDAFRKRGYPYQMHFNQKVKLTPLHVDMAALMPQYMKLAVIPRTCDDEEELIDVTGILLFVEETRDVTTANDTQPVREIVITDISNSHPRTMTISAWNDFAVNEGSELKEMEGAFPVVGFTALRRTSHKGFSLATTMSTYLMKEPTGEEIADLWIWGNTNRSFLVQLKDQVQTARSTSTEETITLVADINAKKAGNTIQEEKFWIKVKIEPIEIDALYAYVGFHNCGRKSNVELGSVYNCMNCNTTEATGIPCPALKFNVIDQSGKRQFTIFSKDVEKLFQLTLKEVYNLYHDDDRSSLKEFLSKFDNKEVMFQVGPTTALNTSNRLNWVIRNIKLLPDA